MTNHPRAIPRAISMTSAQHAHTSAIPPLPPRPIQSRAPRPTVAKPGSTWWRRQPARLKPC
ncbi:hypothetical protein K505DRAFT_327938 [Melanomma pulvis-pyrius CBS 109.77]|uniref:Uncharacterized protein n=1 Tax=Melanomma pulvis-pyrius CBS 109.77 TaxID=1314802 RepID=A0A6A6X088_9PLEO|nr:hypothetical protein K505DRAFT_327938 [Melanomma pulvis-pyrius CBS 109.77]